MASWSPALLELLDRRKFNESQDPRIGSGRDNSTGGTLSTLNSPGSNSASLSALGGTFIPVAVFSAVCLGIFVTFRRKCPRAYAPRTIPGIPLPGDESPPLPTGWFNWIRPLYNMPDTFVLNHGSVDGFFFLRYLKVLATVCIAGCVCVWPILLPLHGTGGRELHELELLTIGNILSPYKFYAHAFVSWCFFGFILFMISRECIFYINLRQAYLLSPHQAHRLSSRTVLFTCVPRHFLDEPRLRKLFGDDVKNIWIPRNTKALEKLVEERRKAAIRLEKAEIVLIKKANAARNAHLASLPPDAPPPNRRASTSSEPGTGKEKDTNHPPSRKPSKGKFTEELDVLERALSDSQPSTAATACASPTTTPDPVSAEGNPPSPTDPTAEDPDSDTEYTHPYGLDPSLPDVRGSVAAQWIPASDRPSHRPIANFGRSVDTIRWSRARVKSLNIAISRLRRRFRSGDGRPLNAVFIEFASQAAAQAAFQITTHHQPLHMGPRFIGMKPRDVVWPALRLRWFERIARRFLVLGGVAAAVIFWSIPSAFVGLVTNVKTLSASLPFLSWIELLPGPILGVFQGLVPPLALSLLMALVPAMLRACARAAGVPSRPLVELFSQNAYFVFQVVQVFLVTTLTSAASAAFTDVLQNPLSAKDLLSKNLPKSSNFYLSYILVQCLAGGAWGLMHPIDLFRYHVLAKRLEHPRRLAKDWYRLRTVHWGAIYPMYTNMAVIAISYSCIAPLILLFAGLGMLFTYMVYKYNLIYSFGSDLDTLGLVYPRALMHMMVGLYMAEVCLIGLFSLQSAVGPVLLMIVFLIFTGLVHISLNDAVSPLLANLPRTLALDDKDLAGSSHEDDAAAAAPAEGHEEGVLASGTGGAAAEYYNVEEGGLPAATTEHFINPATAFSDTDSDLASDPSLDPDTTARSGIEGGTAVLSTLTTWARTKLTGRPPSSSLDPPTNSNDADDNDDDPSPLSRAIAALKYYTTPNRNNPNPHFLNRFLHPEVFDDCAALQAALITPRAPPAYAPDYARRGYWPPEMWSAPPTLWLPRDGARVSRQEVAHCRAAGLEATDRGAWAEGGKVGADAGGEVGRGVLGEEERRVEY